MLSHERAVSTPICFRVLMGMLWVTKSKGHYWVDHKRNSDISKNKQTCLLLFKYILKICPLWNKITGKPFNKS